MANQNTTREEISAYEPWEMPQFVDTDVESAELNQSWKRSEKNVDHVALPTAEELESIHNEAYQDGFEQGQKDGLAEAKTQVAGNIKQLMKIAESLYEPIADQDVQIEQALLQLSVKLVKAILHRELSLDTSQLLTIAKEAIALLPIGAEAMTLYVNAKDLALIMEHRDILSDREALWRIEASDAVAPGGCVVETPQTLIDATIDQRCRDMINQLYDTASSESAEDESLRHPLKDLSEFIEMDPSSEDQLDE